MNKSEFITQLSKTDPPYNMDFDYRQGFNKCKETIIKLAQELDEQGLSVESFKLFRDTLNDLNKTYTDLFTLQRELFCERDKNIKLIQDLQEEKVRNFAAIKLIKNRNLMPQYDEMLKAEQEIINHLGGNFNV